MPIAPPSQIGLDLLRPPDLPEIAARGARRPDGASTATFDVGVNDTRQAAGGAAQTENFKRFEAMVLQTFIQSMLPADGAAVYGKGMAGDMWKSLLAEKMAEVMAERGGIGIADRMLGEHYAVAAKPAGESPAVGQPVTPEERIDSRLPVAPAVIEDMRRSLSELLTDLVLSENMPSENPIRSTTKRG